MTSDELQRRDDALQSWSGFSCSTELSVPFAGGPDRSARLAEITDNPVAWAREVGELVGDPYQLDLDCFRTPDGWKIRKASIDGFKRIDQL